MQRMHEEEMEQQSVVKNVGQNIQLEDMWGLSCLPPETLSKRMANSKTARNVMKREIIRLAKQIATPKSKFEQSPKLCFDGSEGLSHLNDNHETINLIPNQPEEVDDDQTTQNNAFVKEVETVYTSINNNPRKFVDGARAIVVDLLKQGVDGETKKNGYTPKLSDTASFFRGRWRSETSSIRQPVEICFYM